MWLSHVLEQQAFGRGDKDPAAAFADHAGAFPFAHDAAGGKSGDVGGGGEVFVSYPELDASRNFMSDSTGQIDQY